MQIVDENNQPIRQQSSQRVLAGILGIILGHLGIHKFVLGYVKEGFLQILISIITLGIGSIIGLIEGIIYLTKTDEQFIEEYQINKRPWF